MASNKSARIFCVNTHEYMDVPLGTTLYEIYNQLKPGDITEVANAKVNNIVTDLDYAIFSNKDVEFQGMTCASGMRTYGRSLFFVLSKAVKDLFPGGVIINETMTASGAYCKLEIGQELTDDIIQKLRGQMKTIIDNDYPFVKVTAHTDNAVQLFQQHNHISKVKLLTCHKKLYTTYYLLDGEPDYYYGPLLRSTGQLKVYGLERYNDGLLLRMPQINNPSQLLPFIKQDKMLDIIKEQKEWQKIIGISTIGELNELCRNKRDAINIINVSEALQEKKIAKIAENIKNKSSVRLVLIAGPSSSGKTTFSKRLSIQLVAEGIRPVAISMDDYFVDREHTPLDENGEYDFESVYALDIEHLQRDLKALFDGKQVELPKFDFTTGKSLPSGNKLKIDDKTVIIMEGIHGLNPELTKNIPAEMKYKVFVSALTTIQLDYHNFIPTSDNRLLRRIVRDYKYRNYSAEETISRWSSVIAGENKWIVPFQEEADVMFNSALLFELAGLRTQALPLLEMVPESAPEYSEANRLRNFLNYILPIKIDGLPPTSLLREFMGGSTFHY